MGWFRTLRAAIGAATLIACAATASAGQKKPDLLSTARRFYNEGQYDQALEAAKQAATGPSTASSAKLIVGRTRLERFRQSSESSELDAARDELRAVDPRSLDPRERIEFQVGLGELLYLEERFGPAAEVLDPVVDASATLAPEAHERALDWWATALDRQALLLAPAERSLVYPRITTRMEQELRRDPTSAPASYWLAASVRASGDLDRAWAAASAGWIRAALGRDRGVALRADLDKLVTQGIIPDRAGRLPAKDRRQAVTSLTADWEAFKKIW
jgi:hypothetical protein